MRLWQMYILLGIVFIMVLVGLLNIATFLGFYYEGY